MTSPAQIAANRRNAVRSTGPRTATGKARSRCNAFRHGLSLPLRTDNFFAAQIEELTEKFTAFAGEPREAVRAVAETHLEVARVQKARIEAINRSIRLQSSGADDGLSDEARRSLAIAEIAPTLTAFDRYERRALSRRRKAMRVLESCQRTDGAVLANPAGTTLKSKKMVRPSDTYKKKRERTDAQKAAKVLRLEAATVNYLARSVRYQASLIRKRGRNSNERLHTALCGIADVARKFILLNMPDVALDKINLVLEAAPDHLMLHAVRACALLITGNQEARDVLRRHRGRFDKGIRWEKIILDQLRRLRKAPGMNAEILREVERICEPPESLSTMVLKGPYIQKSTQVAIQFILAREVKNALEVIELALPEMPRSVDLNVVRAHALMFLDRTEEARALYEEFRELRNYMALSGIELIVNHFEMMRAAGLIHPLMHEIQR
jgi:hypothetical protein